MDDLSPYDNIPKVAELVAVHLRAAEETGMLFCQRFPLSLCLFSLCVCAAIWFMFNCILTWLCFAAGIAQVWTISPLHGREHRDVTPQLARDACYDQGSGPRRPSTSSLRGWSATH